MGTFNSMIYIFWMIVAFICKLKVISSSSFECNANTLYSYIYCLYQDSRCSQCTPCYNDETYYFPSGSNIASSCSSSDICNDCIDNNCKNLWDNIMEFNNDSCPQLATLASKEIVEHMPLSHPISLNCGDDLISIKYAMIQSDDDTNCIIDFTSSIKSTCNDHNECSYTYNISSLTHSHSPSCESDDEIIAKTVAFCVPETQTYSSFNNNPNIQPSEDDNDLPLIVMYIVIGVLMLIIIGCFVWVLYLLRDWVVGKFLNQTNNKLPNKTTTKDNNLTLPHHEHKHVHPQLHPHPHHQRDPRMQQSIDFPSGNNLHIGASYDAPDIPKHPIQQNHVSFNTSPDHVAIQMSENNSKLSNLSSAQARPSGSVTRSTFYHGSDISSSNVGKHQSHGPVPTTGGSSHNRGVSQVLHGKNFDNIPTRQHLNSITLPHIVGNMNNKFSESAQDGSHLSTNTASKQLQHLSDIPYDISGTPKQLQTLGQSSHIIKNHHIPFNQQHQQQQLSPNQQNNMYNTPQSQIQQPHRGSADFQASSYNNGMYGGANDHEQNELAMALMNPIKHYGLSPQSQHTQQFEQKTNNNNNNYQQQQQQQHQHQQHAMNIADVYYAPNYQVPPYVHSHNNNNYFMQYDPTAQSTALYDSTKIELIQQREIQLEAEIGRGQSSKVFRARWRTIKVAAKRFTNDFVDTKKAQEYISTYCIKLLSSSHSNVIKVLAYGNEPFTLLTEYMNIGSVKDYVSRKRSGATSLSILNRIELTLQAARGISHLHKLEIIHSEITCSVLLMESITKTDVSITSPLNINKSKSISDNVRVVVTDYGLQTILTADELIQYRSTLGPLKWMAPECIEHQSNTTYQSDIYSFGITMWEIITGQEPYPDVDPVDTAIHVLVKERRPQSYAFIPEPIQNLMKQCWHKDPKKREQAKDVVKKLEKFIASELKIKDI